MYEISVDGLFGGEVRFFGVKPSNSSIGKVKEEIVSALPVLGCYGWCVKSGLDIVVPNFKEDL